MPPSCLPYRDKSCDRIVQPVKAESDHNYNECGHNTVCQPYKRFPKNGNRPHSKHIVVQIDLKTDIADQLNRTRNCLISEQLAKQAEDCTCGNKLRIRYNDSVIQDCTVAYTVYQQPQKKRSDDDTDRYPAHPHGYRFLRIVIASGKKMQQYKRIQA